ncbi:crossover junction endonuclease EME1B [Dendrobium catenatum]|uniref:Crossover junction endonuclease EME1B n=1 Tax=Dendrobium catenatum TaxID=906689 RepID=A0A2I0WW31_9ASPA|nr:crossover junction endonuclease EME1B [Dendrobium catenatum]PKU79853.1 Crossover junction endonuclease EME1B [Dendrobium catenatum]
MGRSQAFFTVDILSDDEEDASCALSPRHSRAKRKWTENLSGGNGESDPPFLVIDDDPTPQKRNPVCTPSVVAETPLSFGSDASIVKCSLTRTHSREKFAGISSLICLESDNESEGGSSRGTLKESGNLVEWLGRTACHSRSPMENSRLDSTSESEDDVLFCRMKDVACEDDLVVTTATAKPYSSNGYAGISDFIKMSGDSLPSEDCLAEDLVAQARHDNDGDGNNYLRQSPSLVKQAGKQRAPNADKDIWKSEAAARKKQLKEEKTRLIEERKQKRQDEKLQKEALKAEAAELKKLEKEKQKWEKGKLALKSIIAEIDAKVLENGSIGGHLLARFAERGLSYRITSNPIEKSILWKITVPEQIAQLSNMMSDVPYILLLYQAEEFCDLVVSESLIDHVHTVRSQYPLFTICYLTNKLMSFINKCEQSHYKNSSNFNSYKRPPVEEVLAKLSTHFTKVHSRQCIDEAEIADHIVGLTSSLANCQFRKKLTWLSVNANGSMVAKNFIDKNLIKNNVWLKALAVIPKVQPKHAIAIWKKYPTMRSLLDVYLDSNKSVHEKEFLLKDLMVEGSLGIENRRFGELCSKRIFRILMAQSGGIRTDDVEDGADLFKC